MSDKEDVPIGKLWELIEANALLGQKHTKWDLYLTRIKVLVEMIENRIERYQEAKGCGQLVQGTEALGENINKGVNQHES